MKRNNFIKSLLGLPLVFSSWSFKKEAKEEVTHFTPEMLDRNNYGLFIINSKVKEITKENIGYAATVSWKLTWNLGVIINHSDNKKVVAKEWSKYTMTNFLTDGFTYPLSYSKEGVCDFLNNDPDGEKYRLMTKEEVLFIISNRKQGFL